MQKLKQTVRFLIASVVAGCILTSTTQIGLFAHLRTNTAHTHCDHDDDHHDDHDQPPQRSHDSKHCSICQVLIGPTSKYLHTQTITGGFEVAPSPFVYHRPSDCIDRYDIIPFPARGPPAC